MGFYFLEVYAISAVIALTHYNLMARIKLGFSAYLARFNPGENYFLDPQQSSDSVEAYFLTFLLVSAKLLWGPKNWDFLSDFARF